MFFKLLNKIRKKSEATRQIITLGISIGITCIVAGAWAFSFIPEANSILGKAKAEDILGPFSKISEKIPAAPSLDPKLMAPPADSQTAAVGAVDFSASTTSATSASSTHTASSASSSATIR